MRHWITALLVCCTALSMQAGALGGGATDVPRVIDGDSLIIGNQRIRLSGIDAPELRQTCARSDGRRWQCGASAKTALVTLANAGGLSCAATGTDPYGRRIAICRAGGRDLGAAMVAKGLALAFGADAAGYRPIERAAKRAGIGLWQGRHQTPAAYRAAAAGGDGRCTIKGNVSAGGRIFHLPGQRFYQATKIDPASGDRWFCSERDAEAAGWRKAAV